MDSSHLTILILKGIKRSISIKFKNFLVLRKQEAFICLPKGFHLFIHIEVLQIRNQKKMSQKGYLDNKVSQ